MMTSWLAFCVYRTSVASLSNSHMTSQVLPCECSTSSLRRGRVVPGSWNHPDSTGAFGGCRARGHGR